MLRKPEFNLKVVTKSQEVCNVQIEAKNISMTKNYTTQGCKGILIILNWLGWEEPRFMETLNYNYIKYNYNSTF